MEERGERIGCGEGDGERGEWKWRGEEVAGDGEKTYRRL